jgi:hypothetical protein
VALTSILPGRIGIARPHAIKGVRDPSLDYLYWLQHFARGGDVLVPDDDTALVQPVDVLDVAEWIVDCVDQRRAGPYNLCARPVALRAFLERSRQAIRSRARLVWVAPSFLVAHDVVRTGNLPLTTVSRLCGGAISTIGRRSTTRPCNLSRVVTQPAALRCALARPRARPGWDATRWSTQDRSRVPAGT